MLPAQWMVARALPGSCTLHTNLRRNPLRISSRVQALQGKVFKLRIKVYTTTSVLPLGVLDPLPSPCLLTGQSVESSVLFWCNGYTLPAPATALRCPSPKSAELAAMTEAEPDYSACDDLLSYYLLHDGNMEMAARYVAHVCPCLLRMLSKGVVALGGGGGGARGLLSLVAGRIEGARRATSRVLPLSQESVYPPLHPTRCAPPHGTRVCYHTDVTCDGCLAKVSQDGA